VLLITACAPARKALQPLWPGVANYLTRQRRHLMLKKIYTATVPVTDQDRALTFYRDVLGMEVRDDQAFGPGMRWLVVAPQGAETGLVLYKAGEGENVASPGSWTGIVLYTDDMAKDYAAWSAQGVQFSHEPKSEMWGLETQFTDPDGNGFDLVQRAQ
jgi:predicted enzyme related to lactoylglutathione lyase